MENRERVNLASGNYHWNAGMLFVQIFDRFLDVAARTLPRPLPHWEFWLLQSATQKSASSDRKVYSKLENVSVDYSVHLEPVHARFYGGAEVFGDSAKLAGAILIVGGRLRIAWRNRRGENESFPVKGLHWTPWKVYSSRRKVLSAVA